MKKKNQVFFSQDGSGITVTSANHLCNIAKEYVSSALNRLYNISFLITTVESLDSDKKIILSTGANSAEVAALKDEIDKIANVNIFIAYMREAIKAKEDELRAVKSYSSSEYAKEQGIEMPSAVYNNPDAPTFEDFLGELDIKERNRYYALGAEAAVIGKLIHPLGSIHTARENLFSAVSEPAKLEDDKIYRYEPSVSQDQVEEVYFELQKKHRAIEASLNAIKGSIEQRLTEAIAKLDNERIKAEEEYTNQSNVFLKKYEAFKNQKMTEIGKLKVIIPNELKDTYDFLSTL